MPIAGAKRSAQTAPDSGHVLENFWHACYVHWTIDGRLLGPFLQFRDAIYTRRFALSCWRRRGRRASDCGACNRLGLHVVSKFDFVPPLARLSPDQMSGLEVAGIVLAIPGILHLINRAITTIKDVCCALASKRPWY
jgi:hypothetical protein